MVVVDEVGIDEQAATPTCSAPTFSTWSIWRLHAGRVSAATLRTSIIVLINSRR